MAASFCLLVGKMCLLLFSKLFRTQKVIDGRSILLTPYKNEFFSDKLSKVVFDAADAA